MLAFQAKHGILLYIRPRITGVLKCFLQPGIFGIHTRGSVSRGVRGICSDCLRVRWRRWSSRAQSVSFEFRAGHLLYYRTVVICRKHAPFHIVSFSPVCRSLRSRRGCCWRARLLCLFTRTPLARPAGAHYLVLFAPSKRQPRASCEEWLRLMFQALTNHRCVLFFSCGMEIPYQFKTFSMGF